MSVVIVKRERIATEQTEKTLARYGYTPLLCSLENAGLEVGKSNPLDDIRACLHLQRRESGRKFFQWEDFFEVGKVGFAGMCGRIKSSFRLKNGVFCFLFGSKWGCHEPQICSE